MSESQSLDPPDMYQREVGYRINEAWAQSRGWRSVIQVQLVACPLRL
jgi:hypothetical protein